MTRESSKQDITNGNQEKARECSCSLPSEPVKLQVEMRYNTHRYNTMPEWIVSHILQPSGQCFKRSIFVKVSGTSWVNFFFFFFLDLTPNIAGLDRAQATLG